MSKRNIVVQSLPDIRQAIDGIILSEEPYLGLIWFDQGEYRVCCELSYLKPTGFYCSALRKQFNEGDFSSDGKWQPVTRDTEQVISALNREMGKSLIDLPAYDVHKEGYYIEADS